MKYLIIILTITFAFENSLSQTLTQDEKQRIIAALNDSSITARHSALFEISKYKIVEAKDSLERKIWNDERSLQVNYLQALYAVGSNKTHEYALRFLDTLDVNPFGNSKYVPELIELKVRTTGVLFKLGDYTTYDYVFQMLDRDSTLSNDIFAIELLPEIIKHVPEQRERAKNELVKAAFSSDVDIMRFWALTQLTELYGEETLSTILHVLETDAETSVRGTILAQFLPSDYNEEINKTLRRMLYKDSVTSIRNQIIDNLLYRHGRISDYKFVKDYLNHEPDSTLFFTIKTKLEQYKTLQPDSTITSSTMLDTLISYTNQCYGYEWLKDEAYKNELLNKLTNAKSKLTAGDSLGCRREVEAFQNSVNQVYQDSAGSFPKYVSEEGYKFLYYYAGYILDRFTEIKNKNTRSHN